MSETTERQCGTCTACCKTIRVDLLDKKAGVWCPYRKKDAGCSIFGKIERPGDCNKYKCVWLKGKLNEGDKPSELDVVMDIRRYAVVNWRRKTLRMMEVDEGCFNNPRIDEIANEFLKQEYIVLKVRRVPLGISESGLQCEATYPDFIEEDERQAFQDLLNKYARKTAANAPD